MIVGERYRVVDELGVGGMGAVFLVEHVHIERRAAMKVLRVERWSEELVRRFHREARAAARVVSERVTSVTDFGMDPVFGPFYVMDVLHGETLEQRLERDGGVPEEELIHIAIGIAEALIDVHAEGIVHRDVKPSNVGLSSGSVPVKLLDFGLAAATEEAAFLERITRSNEIIGSVAYMSPEQLQGFRPTFAVDLYSFGVTLYEAATGRLPFGGASPGVIIAQHISAAPPPLGLGAAGVPVSIELDALTRQLMAKDPARRLPSAIALRDALVTIQRRGRNSYPQARASVVVETRAAEAVRSSPPRASPSPAVSSGVRSVGAPEVSPPLRPSMDSPAPSPSQPGRAVSPYGPTVGLDASSPAMPLLPTSLVPGSFPPTISTRAAPGGAGPASSPGPWADARTSAPSPDFRSHAHGAAPGWGVAPMGGTGTERVMAPTLAAMPHMSAAPSAPTRSSSNGLLFAGAGLGAGMVLATLVVLGVMIATRSRTPRSITLPPPTAIAPPVVHPSVLQPDPRTPLPLPAAAQASSPPAPTVVPATSPATPATAPSPAMPATAPSPAMPGIVLPHPEPVDAGISTRARPSRPSGPRLRSGRPEMRDDEPPMPRPISPPPAPPPTRRQTGPWAGEVIDDPR